MYYKNEYMKSYLKARRRIRKKRLVEMRGGCCELCGYDRCIEALEFHHRDSSTKEFVINGSILAAKKWETILAEVDKCDMICANCHREIVYLLR